MIDLVFLLLVFFILTTKFIPEEEMISALLPNNGQGDGQRDLQEEPIQVRVYPAAMSPGMDVGLLDTLWHHDPSDRQVMVRIGNHDAGLVLDGQALSSPDGSANQAALSAIHQYIAAHLESRELTVDSRSEQDPVEIHAFSGISWKFALSAFDAVRDYENRYAVGSHDETTMWADAREVRFAPPNIRGNSATEMGDELYRIINQ
jgi:hypothetical protein